VPCAGRARGESEGEIMSENYKEPSYDTIDKLQEDNKNLMCCGNCGLDDKEQCPFWSQRQIITFKHRVCWKWTFDDLTQEERIIK